MILILRSVWSRTSNAERERKRGASFTWRIIARVSCSHNLSFDSISVTLSFANYPGRLRFTQPHMAASTFIYSTRANNFCTKRIINRGVSAIFPCSTWNAWIGTANNRELTYVWETNEQLHVNEKKYTRPKISVKQHTQKTEWNKTSNVLIHKKSKNCASANNNLI